MEKLIKALEVQRTSFERIYEETLMLSDSASVHGNLQVLQQKIDILMDLDRQVLEKMLDSDMDDVEIDLEVEKADAILGKYNRLKAKVEFNHNKDSVSGSSNSLKKQNLKLPKIELKRFGGHLKDWLLFWGQFRRIHEDTEIETEDKFQYLIQATERGSRARKIVESFPPTCENYPIVIDSLKNRFGREDLLIEVYVRELLGLVVANINSKTKNLTQLYDNLDSHLRSLETLGISSDKFAAMLFPLVESCLPEMLLRIWQRSTNYNPDNSSKYQLDSLMNFLKKEVEGEEKVSLVRSGFGLNNSRKTDENMSNTPNTFSIPTASTLVNNDNRRKKNNIKCVFCRDSHASTDCNNEDIKKLSFEDKKKMLIKSGRCYLCLKFGHFSKSCRSKLVCSFCKQKHVDIMCHVGTSNYLKENSPVAVENLSNIQFFNETFLQTLCVKVINGSKSLFIRAIIDSGSQKSYITSHAALKLGYKIQGKEDIVHSLFGGATSKITSHTVFRVSLMNLEENYMCNFNALDQPLICNQVTSIRSGPWYEELQSLNVTISDRREGPIEVLIGADIAGKLLTGRKHVLKCGLVAVETKLGWTLMGKVHNSNDNNSKISSSMVVTSLLSNNELSNLWSLDVLGIENPEQRTSKKENDEKTMKTFLESVTVNSEGRYEIGLPWVKGHAPLGNNFDSAKKRLDNLMSKLQVDGYYETYNEVFSEWLSEGIIEEIPRVDLDCEEMFYLPHRHVLNLSSSTTKLRPVFDASANKKGHPSLNQCLEKGINLIELIPTILIKFRLHRLGVISDIRKAFLQISLNESDRNVLRFLWYKPNGELAVFRHTRVVFGLTSSPFHLTAVIKYHLDKVFHYDRYPKWVINQLKDSFYVDNCTTSVNNEIELTDFVREASNIMLESKFELRNWEYTLIDGKDLEENSKCMSSVLGLQWDRRLDTIEVNLRWLEQINFHTITKRTILSVANRLFDPIGFTCPVQLFPKLLLQKLCQSKLKWDVAVPEDIMENFLKWLKELPLLAEIHIPRWLFVKPFSKISLHMFSDASKDAYSAVIFLRCESQGEVHVQLVQGKSRVAPLKNLSIPRLELLGATIGSRLVVSVAKSLINLDFLVYCWCDSTAVLSWIRNDEYWKPFVWNRCTEIRKLVDRSRWFYVPSQLNPADLISRGCSAKRLVSSYWWDGPMWLKDPLSWPKQHFESNEKEILEEKRSTIKSFLNAKEDFSSFYYFSNYNRILNHIGWVKRFIYNSRLGTCSLPCHSKSVYETKRIGNLSVKEIDEAEFALIRLVQQESFEGIKDKSINSLHPFFDANKVMRIKTKITQREDTFDFLYPILLPSKHVITNRIVMYYHLQNFHVGLLGLISKIREKFWILKTRKTVRAILKKCVVCQRYEAKSLSADSVVLPADRVRDTAVFEIVGIDLTGPLLLKSGEKVWICIFTCAVYRAVHLELVPSLSTESFLLALRRFIARRGRCSIIYSDNGTNFVGTVNYLQKIDWDIIQKATTSQRITWKFNPATAAWWGGWWERIIRIIKQLLRKQLGRTSLNYEELSSVICECEAIVNSRPLTYVGEENRDLVPLTPSMFLQDITEIGTPDLDAADKTSFKRHIRYLHRLRADLRKRFREEYLGKLILNSRRKSNRIKVGDLVFIESDKKKRMDWLLGLVVEVFPGKDQNVRVVKLKTSSGMLLRPIQRLHPLELDELEQEGVKEGLMFKKAKEEEQKHKSNISSRKLKPTCCTFPDGSKVAQDIEEKHEERRNVPEERGELKPDTTRTRYGRESRPPKRF